MGQTELQRRVGKLEQAVAAFAAELRLALGYVHEDAGSSLTKSRLVLEKLMRGVYGTEMGRDPRKPLLGDMLADNQFTRRIERRILSRMHAIRDLGNLGPHGEAVEPSDAALVLDNLCEVLEWYLRRYGDPEADVPQSAGAEATADPEAAARLESLRRLVEEFYRPLHLRLQRDNLHWRRVKDLREPEGSMRRRVAESIERDYILPNHDEMVALIESRRHLVAADDELAPVLDTYLRHVVVYKAIRASGDAVTLPIRVGAPWPADFFPLVARRLASLAREYEELARGRKP